MKIPISHYIYFWFINSILALGTGIIMGLVTLRIASMLFAISTEDVILSIVLGSPLLVSFGCLFIYQFVAASFFWGKRRGAFEYSFLEKSAEKNKELGARLKKINQELKYCDQKSAYSKLKEAIKMYPENFVMQFRYAISCERVGQAEDAIAAYAAAVNLISSSSEALTVYVNEQINRVKTKGPSKGAAVPGLKYVLY